MTTHQIGRINFFDSIEKKVWFFEFFKKVKKHSFQHLLTSFRFLHRFFPTPSKNFAGGQFSLCVWLRARLIYEVWISQIKLRTKVPRFFLKWLWKTLVKIVKVVCGRFFNLCGKAFSTCRVDLKLVRITKFPRFPTRIIGS